MWHQARKEIVKKRGQYMNILGVSAYGTRKQQSNKSLYYNCVVVLFIYMVLVMDILTLHTTLHKQKNLHIWGRRGEETLSTNSYLTSLSYENGQLLQPSTTVQP